MEREPRRTRWIRGVLIAAALLGGAPRGGAMGVPPGEIPTPKRSFHARLTDALGVVTEVRDLSIDGDVVLTGDRGRSTVSIPFDQIRDLSFSTLGPAPEAPTAVVSVELRDGASAEIRVKGRLVWYGRSDFGLFQIKTRDLKRIDFLGGGTGKGPAPSEPKTRP